MWLLCPFSWGTCGFPLHVMQLAALLGFHTLLTPVGCPTPAVGVQLGVRGVLVQMSCFPTWFLPCAGTTPPSAFFPLWGSAPLTGASACLSPVCWSTPGVGLVGSLLRHLVFSHVSCYSSGPAACAAFPAAGYLGVFPVTGCLSFCFPGGVG